MRPCGAWPALVRHWREEQLLVEERRSGLRHPAGSTSACHAPGSPVQISSGKTEAQGHHLSASAPTPALDTGTPQF